MEHPETNPNESPLSFSLLTDGGVASFSTGVGSTESFLQYGVPRKPLGRFLDHFQSDIVGQNSERDSTTPTLIRSNKKEHSACAVAHAYPNWSAVSVVE